MSTINGSVKWFNTKKGYGFISARSNDNTSHDFFFHISELKEGEIPKSGDWVSFVPKIGKKDKPIATNVLVQKKIKCSILW